MFDASFWVAAGLIILLSLIGKPVWRFILRALDDKRETIKKDIQEAAQLKREAEQVLKEAQKKHREAFTQAENILKHAFSESERLQEEMTQQLEDYRNVEEARLKSRLKLLEAEALNDIKNQALTIALKAAEDVLQNTMNPDQERQIIDQTLSQIKDLPVARTS